MQTEINCYMGQYQTFNHGNGHLFSLKDTVFSTEIAATAPGEFPVDAWHPLFLEVPQGNSKTSISGRFPGLLISSAAIRVKQDMSRVISLPVYENTARHRQNGAADIVVSEHFPDTLPLVTLANRYDGYYCDGRRAQAVSVLMMNHDGTASLLELDWCEGPLEDCVSPEWSIRATLFLTLKDGLNKFRKVCLNSPMWENCSFYLYVVPPFLGSYLLGEGKSYASKTWQLEWSYSKHADLLAASNRIIAAITELPPGKHAAVTSLPPQTMPVLLS